MSSEQRMSKVYGLISGWAEKYPRCFAVLGHKRRPLKIGIFEDLLAAMNGSATSKDVGLALCIYTSNRGYIGALRAGAPRINLAGEAVGIVTAKEAEHAQQRLNLHPAKASPKPMSKPLHRLSLADLRQAAAARRKFGTAA